MRKNWVAILSLKNPLIQSLAAAISEADGEDYESFKRGFPHLFCSDPPDQECMREILRARLAELNLISSLNAAA